MEEDGFGKKMTKMEMEIIRKQRTDYIGRRWIWKEDGGGNQKTTGRKVHIKITTIIVSIQFQYNFYYNSTLMKLNLINYTYKVQSVKYHLYLYMDTPGEYNLTFAHPSGGVKINRRSEVGEENSKIIRKRRDRGGGEEKKKKKWKEKKGGKGRGGETIKERTVKMGFN